jgi:hypothetical protein
LKNYKLRLRREKMKGKVFVVVACLLMLSVPSVMAEGPCTADFDCTQTVDADDVTEFLNQFGRSIYNDPCPDCYDSPCPCTPAPVPKTGQTLCYDSDGNPRDCAGTGEDGEHQKGVELPNPRFTDNGDETITDNLTGLIWQKDARCMATNYPGFENDGTDGDGALTWQHAFDFIAGINAGIYPDCGAGYDDWRMPNSNELVSLVNKRYYNPAVSNTAGTGQGTEGDPFINQVPSGLAWASTTVAHDNDQAWIVKLSLGRVNIVTKTAFISVRAVRGGQ